MNTNTIFKQILIFIVLSLVFLEPGKNASLAADELQYTTAPAPNAQDSGHSSNTGFAYDGQPVFFTKMSGVGLYADSTGASGVAYTLEPDVLVVKTSSTGKWTGVFVPALSQKGYVRTSDITDSILSPKDLAKKTAAAAQKARNLVLEQFKQNPSLELMEKAGAFSFMSEKDMRSMVSRYRGDISKLPFQANDSMWSLSVNGLPEIAARSCGPDTAGTSLFADTSRVVLLGGAPYLYQEQSFSLPDNVRNTISDPKAVYLRSNYFCQGLRLIRLVRSMTRDPIIVSHDPPFSDAEIKVNFHGVGRFVHTFPRRFPVTLLTKNGFVSGSLVSISHSEFRCDCHGEGDNFILKSPLPSENGILGIVFGFQRPNGAKPRIRVKSNGSWTADLDGDGKADMKCVVQTENQGDHLIHSTNEVAVGHYYYVKRGGIWCLTDIRLEPMCT